MTETESMVVRVAKAIEKREDEWLRREGDARDGFDEDNTTPLYVAMARAAIEAMKEPTPGMVDAIHDGDFDIYWSYRADGTPGSPDDVWSAMIVKALEE